MKKRIFLWIVLVFTSLIIIANLVSYVCTKKTIPELLFQSSSETPVFTKDILEELMVVSNESAKEIVYEGYTIKLEKYLYDAKSGFGFLKLAVCYDEWELIDKYEWYDRFFEKFKIAQTLESQFVRDCVEYGDNTLYIYYEIANRSYQPDPYIYFADKDELDEEQKIPGIYWEGELCNIVGKFELKDTGCGICYELEEGGELIVTPLGICTYGYSSDKITDLTVLLKNGKTMKLLESGESCQLAMFMDNEFFRIQYREGISTGDITGVKFNNSELKKREN